MTELSLPPSSRFRTNDDSGGAEVSPPPCCPRLTAFPNCADACIACAAGQLSSDVFVEEFVAPPDNKILISFPALRMLSFSSVCGCRQAHGRRSAVEILLR